MLKIYATELILEIEEVLFINQISERSDFSIEESTIYTFSYEFRPEYKDWDYIEYYIELYELAQLILDFHVVLTRDSSLWYFLVINSLISITWIISWSYMVK